MKLAIIGCGKMGLPIAVQAASSGLEKVIGVDVNKDIVTAINQGISPITEPDVGKMLCKAKETGCLEATTDIKYAVSQVDAVIVIVPVLLTDSKQADLEIIMQVTHDISRSMQAGTLISYETTLPVGTTRNIFAPILEKSGLEIEHDFFLVFSPERVKSLHVMEHLNKIPKVVGAYGPESLAKGLNLYKTILTAEIINVETLENAEMVKLGGMIYRDINIALSNELARYCDTIGIDLPELISAINTNGEAHLLQPGIGVGGHCTPVYPYFLIKDAETKGQPQSLAELSRGINDGQAKYAIDQLTNYLGDLTQKTILLLGLGFRPDVKEDAKSPAYLVKTAFEQRDAMVFLFDPLYSKDEITKKGFHFQDLNNLNPESVDAIVLITAHSAFLNLNWKNFSKKGVQVFIDGRNCIQKSEVEKSGIKYIGIGRGIRL